MSDYIIFKFFAYWLGSMISYYYYWIKEEEDGKPLSAICYCFFWPVGWICSGIRDVWNGRKKKLQYATTSTGCCIYDNEGRRIVGMMSEDVEVNDKWSNQVGRESGKEVNKDIGDQIVKHEIIRALRWESK